MIESVQGRLKPQFLDLYAEDYHADGSASVGAAAAAASSPAEASTRNGMTLLSELHDAKAKLEKALPLVAAWSKDKFDVEAIVAASVDAAAAGIVTVKSVCVKASCGHRPVGKDGQVHLFFLEFAAGPKNTKLLRSG